LGRLFPVAAGYSLVMSLGTRNAEFVTYVIRHALSEEANEGWVWIHDPCRKEPLGKRAVVTIRRPGHCRCVYVEVRKIDCNFLRQYNRRPRINIRCELETITMSEWYRDALGIRATDENNCDGRVQLNVRKANLWGWRSLRAACHHPDPVVRLGTRLGILGVWLGLSGVWLGIWGASLAVPCERWVGYVAWIMLAIVVISVPFGFWGCWGRPRLSPT
jgi:hypothetical protein